MLSKACRQSRKTCSQLPLESNLKRSFFALLKHLHVVVLSLTFLTNQSRSVLLKLEGNTGFVPMFFLLRDLFRSPLNPPRYRSLLCFISSPAHGLSRPIPFLLTLFSSSLSSLLIANSHETSCVFSCCCLFAPRLQSSHSTLPHLSSTFLSSLAMSSYFLLIVTSPSLPPFPCHLFSLQFLFHLVFHFPSSKFHSFSKC